MYWGVFAGMGKGYSSQPPERILIASANPLFSKGLEQQLSTGRSTPPEIRRVSDMAETLAALQSWQPDLVMLDYDDRAINRAEFLNHFVAGDRPMRVMLVSLQESGEVMMYDRRTMTPAQAETWLEELRGRPSVRNHRVRLLTPWWIVTTVLVLIAAAVMVRLGFWQLDRLSERRAHNSQARAQAELPPLNLNADLPADLERMDMRAATVSGEYLIDREIILRNQVWQDRLGVHLLTPLRILGSGEVMLVDRGWIPLEQAGLPDRLQYSEAGRVTVMGLLRKPPAPRSVAGVRPVAGSEAGWNTIDLKGIQAQLGMSLLPVVLIAAPEGGSSDLPYRLLPELILTEGSHLGYAIQWFSFAAILLVGYPFFVRRQVRGAGRVKTELREDM